MRTFTTPLHTATAGKVLAIVTTAGLLLSACQTTEENTAENTAGQEETTAAVASKTTETATTEPEEPKTTEETTTARSAAFRGSQPLQQPASQAAELTIDTIRSGHHEDFDRVVVDLSGSGTPGWFIDVTADPRGDGSGLPIDYAGQTAIVVDVRGIAAPFGPSSDEVHTPSVKQDPSATLLSEVQDLGWFEGSNRILIGSAIADPHVSVNTLSNPTRLVIDIARRG